ncbi:signal peptidase I [Microgenomates group bacterium RIFCSPLOWO2_01_FULL_46_13]|nr:MAG: signal peptidase I [Microgenomates group bacterium RIFCSPLOWO2_01_FULL_46_13]
MKIIKLTLLIFQSFLFGALLGVVSVFTAGKLNLLPPLEVAPFVIMSGSMAPAIPAGSVIASLPSPSYQVGDIISFKTDGKSIPVTHRLVAKLTQNSQTVYLTKGDANEEPDQQLVKTENILGKVSLTLPYLGFGVNFAKTPQGFILLVVIPATIVVYEELKSLAKELLKITKTVFNYLRRHSFSPPSQTIAYTLNPIPSNFVLPKTFAILPIVGATLVLLSLSAAYFHDIEASLGNILGAAENFDLPTPTPTPLPLPTPTPTTNIVICHAAGRADDPANFVTLTLPWNAIYGPSGHFNEDGTPQAGHEEDYLGPCQETSSVPTPTTTPLESTRLDILNAIATNGANLNN